MRPYIEKLFAGKVKRVGDPNANEVMSKQWETAMFKDPIFEPIWLSKNGLVGDEVADTKNHGGPEKAIFTYPSSHYEFWKTKLDVPSIDASAMGENLSVNHMDEDSVCLGDKYKVGEAVIQVSQPRQPCWKPARRFRVIDFALQIQQTGKTGWYFRVIEEGTIQGEQELILVERPCPQWTISKCNEVMHVKKDNLQLTKELATNPYLAESWKNTLTKRLDGEQSKIENRVFGPNVESN